MAGSIFERSPCGIIAAMVETSLNLIGLFVGILGALLLAFSVARNPGEAHQTVQGKKLYLSVIHEERVRWGAFLIVVAFCLQFASAAYVAYPMW
jgi:hypothetical protein